MNELLPVIRRKRRPLVVAIKPPVVVDDVERVEPEGEVTPQPARPANADEETGAE